MLALVAKCKGVSTTSFFLIRVKVVPVSKNYALKRYELISTHSRLHSVCLDTGYELTFK
jgi:hypothetical protein